MSAARTRAPEYLTLNEAAAILRTSPRTLTRLAQSGRLRGARLNREWRFTREQVEAALVPTPAPEVQVVKLIPYAEPLRVAESARRAIRDGRAH